MNSEKTKFKEDWIIVIYLVVGILATSACTYWLSNPNYIYYSVGIWLLYVIIRYLVKRNFSEVITLLMTLLGSFFLVVLFFSISPALKIKEFELTHPTWKTGNIDSYSLNAYYRATSKGGHPTTDVVYTYSFKNNKYENKEKNAIKYVQYFFQFKSDKELLESSKNITQRTMDNKDYVLLVDANKPRESQLFLLTSWLNFRYSLLAQMFFTISVLVFLTIICVVSYLSYKAGISPLEYLKRKKKN